MNGAGSFARTMAIIFVALAAVACVTSSATPPAAPPAAPSTTHDEKGETVLSSLGAAFKGVESKEWGYAYHKFLDAYDAQDGKAPPGLVFNIALAADKSSDRRLRAIYWYEVFLQMVPHSELKADIQKRISKLLAEFDSFMGGKIIFTRDVAIELKALFVERQRLHQRSTNAEILEILAAHEKALKTIAFRIAAAQAYVDDKEGALETLRVLGIEDQPSNVLMNAFGASVSPSLARRFETGPGESDEAIQFFKSQSEKAEIACRSGRLQHLLENYGRLDTKRPPGTVKNLNHARWQYDVKEVKDTVSPTIFEDYTSALLDDGLVRTLYRHILEACPFRWKNPAQLAAAQAALSRSRARIYKTVAGTSLRDCPQCPEMVVVPAGSFTMGDLNGGGDRDERPRHRVTIPHPFAVGKFEVTFSEWDTCVSAGGCQHRPDDKGWGRGRRPVMNVSWEDAGEYAAWLSRKTGKAYRLATEAEWEYMARAGTTTKHPWGNDKAPSRAKYDDDSFLKEKTVPVGSYRPNAFGVYDTSGNVWEWTQDCWHKTYIGAPADGSAWIDGGDCGSRAVRSGPWDIRSATRIPVYPNVRGLPWSGFRVVRAVD